MEFLVYKYVKIELYKYSIVDYFQNLSRMSCEYCNFQERVVFYLTKKGMVELPSKTYDYSSDEIVIALIKKYKKVKFSRQYNSPLNWLPEGTTHIYLGTNFNQPLDNLPSTVKQLEITVPYCSYDCEFNQYLNNLPSGLEVLTLHNIQNVKKDLISEMFSNLPPTLKEFTLLTKYAITEPLNALPDNIETISICSFDLEQTFKVPANLKKIIIPCTFVFKVQRAFGIKFPHVDVSDK